MKKKILVSIAFLFLMIVLPNGVKASPPQNCTEITSGSYKLGTNFNLSSGIYCIYAGSDVTIDLNDHDNIGENIEIYNQGKLLFKDSNFTERQFDLENLGYGYISIYGDNESNNNTGEVTIDNGNFAFVYFGSMKKLIINSGTFFGDDYGLGIENLQNVEIKDGIFEGEWNGVSFWDIDNVIISGGNFSGLWNGVYFYNVNSIKLSGGTYKATGEDEDESNIVGAIAENGNKGQNIFQTYLEEGFKYSKEFETKVAGDTDYPYTVAHIKELSVEQIIVDYNILDGDNQEIEFGSSLTVRADGEVANFVKLLLDEEEVAPENYEIKEGSTIVTLNSDFLMTLKEGIHDLTFVYKNGEVSTQFVITNEKTSDDTIIGDKGTSKTNLGPKKIKVPSTGKTISIIIIIVVLCSLVVGSIIFGYSYTKSKKERKKVQ